MRRDIPPAASSPLIAMIVERPNRGSHWLDDCFAAIDVTTSEGLTESMARLREKKPPLEFELFWQAVIRRVPTGREMEFLNAVISGSELDTCEIRLRQ